MIVAEHSEPVEEIPEEVEFPAEEVRDTEYVKWEKCDQECPAESKHVFVSSMSNHDLVFCDHHAHEQAEELFDQGFYELLPSDVVDDEPQQIVDEPIDYDPTDEVE